MIQYTPEEYRRIREVSIKTLKEFIRICDKYQLTYFAIAGTAIGAVRHQGFIPWDDDIDIGMLRKDYDHFQQVAPAEVGDTYKLYSASLQKRVQGFFIQMFHKDSLFITKRNTRWPLHPGIKIDIFPYDNIPVSGKQREKLYNKQRFWNRLYIIRNTQYPFFYGNGVGVKITRLLCIAAYYAMKVTGPSIDTIVKRYESLMRMYSEDSGYYTIMDDMNPDEWYIKKDEIYPLQEVYFEDVLIKIPAKNHEILKRQYGEYMQLPPEEERKGHDVVKIKFPVE